MNTEWTNILLQGFAGGITGYVTNNYALNMLFREYTPLKLGGVIKKTKNEFIAAISQLVERDLLSPSHLKEEFLKEEALEEWNILFASLWDEFFQADFQGVAISEIPGIQKNLPDWIEVLVASGLRPIQEDRGILPDLTLGDLLNQESFSFLLKRILMQSIAEIQQGTMIDPILGRLLAAVEGRRPADFISEEDLAAISISLDQLASQGLSFLLDDPDAISRAIQKLLNHEEIGSLLDRWEEGWGSRPLFASMSADQILEIKTQLRQLVDYWAQDEKKALLAEEIAGALSASPILDTPILACFDEPTRQNIRILVQRGYRAVIKSLTPWLASRESDIKARIKRAAETELSLQAGMIGGMIQGPLNKTVDQMDLTALLADYQDRGQEALMHLLESKSLRALGLTPHKEQSLALIESLLAYAQNHLDGVMDTLFQQAPTAWIGSNWQNRFDNHQKSALAKSLSNAVHEWLSAKASHQTGIHAGLQDLMQRVWTAEKTESLIRDLKRLNLQPLQTAVIAQIEPLYQRLRHKNMPNHWIQAALSNDELQEGLKKQLHEMAGRRLERPIHDFLSPLNQTASRNAFGENLIALIEDHGEEFLDGQVAGLVKTNLEGRDEEEIVELAHDFIGRELQPITKFGFLLGLVAGILLALFPLPQTLMVGPVDLFPVAIFAIVGVLTNWIALQMIFRPYKEIKWMKKIPFFRHFAHGYLLKNQRVFAINLAKFVDESLLNRNMIQQLFSDQKKNLKQRWLKWIPHKLPGWSQITLERKQEELASGISRQAQDALLSHAKSWGDDLAHSMAATPLPADDPRLQKWLESKGGVMLSQSACQWLKNNGDQPLSAWITSDSLPTFITPLLNRLQWRLPGKGLESQIKRMAAPVLTDRILPKKNGALNDLLGGLPAAWIRENLEDASGHLLRKGQAEIQKREAKVANAVNKQIQGSLNFLQRGGFVLMGGPALIERIIHRILTEELPDLIRQESPAITAALKPALDRILSQKQAATWQLAAKAKEDLHALIGRNAESILAKEAITFESFPCNRAACDRMLQDLHASQGWVDEYMGQELALLASPLLDRISIREIVSLAPESAIHALVKNMQSAEDYKSIAHDGWKNILNTLARNTVIGDWIPVSLLTEQMEDLLTMIGSQADYQALIAQMTGTALPALTKAVVSNSLLMDWLAENSFDPLYHAAHGQLPALLSTLSFQDHIVNEVDALPPKGIHEIFLSFAGSYFIRLEVYGLFGAVFGLHPVLPGLALVSEGWTTIKRKNRKGEKA